METSVPARYRFQCAFYTFPAVSLSLVRSLSLFLAPPSGYIRIYVSSEIHVYTYSRSVWIFAGSRLGVPFVMYIEHLSHILLMLYALCFLYGYMCGAIAFRSVEACIFEYDIFNNFFSSSSFQLLLLLLLLSSSFSAGSLMQNTFSFVSSNKSHLSQFVKSRNYNIQLFAFIL